MRIFCFMPVLLLLVTSNVAGLSDIEHPSKVITTLAFGSCHKRKYVDTSGGRTIWDTISQQSKPDAFVWTGDSVYPPTRGIASVALLQEEYNQMKQNQSLGYASFQPPFGIYGIWDDHDYGGNDLGIEMPDKLDRALAFLNFVDKSLIFRKERRTGIYHSVEWGLAPQKVKVLLLDTRSFREVHCIPSVAHKIPVGAAISCFTRWLTAGLNLPSIWKHCGEGSLLGQEQWAWLEQQVKESDAQIHVVVSSVQVLTSNPVMESWGHFPTDRKRLLTLVNGLSGAVLISGDVHHAEILSPAPNSTKSTFLEVTSSGLTHDCAKPWLYGGLCKPLLETFDVHRLNASDFYIGKNYGTLEVDWDRESFQVLVRDNAGEVVLSTGQMPIQQERLSDEELDQVAPAIDGHLIPKVRATLFSLLLALVIQRRLRRRQ